MLWQNNSDVMVPLQPQHGQDATRLLVNFNSGLLESVQRKTTIIKKNTSETMQRKELMKRNRS